MRESSYEHGRFLIATEYSRPIKEKLQLIVEGVKYTIRVSEEESFRVVSSGKMGTEQMIESGAKTDEEDDHVDRKVMTRIQKRVVNRLLDGMANQGSKDADKDVNKENVDCPKVILLGYSK